MRYSSRRVVSVCGSLCCLLAVGSVGCDSGPPLAPVHGVVTVGGKKLAEGQVMFYPEGEGRLATGRIQPDGSYVLKTKDPGDGAQVGKYSVTVMASKVSNAPPAPTSLDAEIATEGKKEPVAKVINLAPIEYSDPATTPLKETVEEKDNEINIEIKAP